MLSPRRREVSLARGRGRDFCGGGGVTGVAGTEYIHTDRRNGRSASAADHTLPPTPTHHPHHSRKQSSRGSAGILGGWYPDDLVLFPFWR